MCTDERTAETTRTNLLQLTLCLSLKEKSRTFACCTRSFWNWLFSCVNGKGVGVDQEGRRERVGREVERGKVTERRSDTLKNRGRERQSATDRGRRNERCEATWLAVFASASPAAAEMCATRSGERWWSAARRIAVDRRAHSKTETTPRGAVLSADTLARPTRDCWRNEEEEKCCAARCQRYRRWLGVNRPSLGAILAHLPQRKRAPFRVVSRTPAPLLKK